MLPKSIFHPCRGRKRKTYVRERKKIGTQTVPRSQEFPWRRGTKVGSKVRLEGVLSKVKQKEGEALNRERGRRRLRRKKKELKKRTILLGLSFPNFALILSLFYFCHLSSSSSSLKCNKSRGAFYNRRSQFTYL